MTTQSIFKGLLRPVLVSAVFFMALTGLAYPVFTTFAAQLLFPFQAQGSLIERDGLVIGSALIGQDFTRPGYFHGRPSMTLGADPQDPSKSVSQPYNAGSSGASNLGPTSQKLVDQDNGLAAEAQVPVDAVTASASGLDPHISVANARIQLARVARLRQIPEAELLQLVNENTAERTLGLLGEPRVNVLQLNLALDARLPLRQPPIAASE